MRKSGKVILSFIMLTAVAAAKAGAQAMSGAPTDSLQSDTVGSRRSYTTYGNAYVLHVHHRSWLNNWWCRTFHPNYGTRSPRFERGGTRGGFGTTVRPLLLVAHS